MSFWRKDHNGADWLGEVAFFEGFTPEDLQRVVALSSEVSANAGTIIIDQGDAGADCFVIVEGTAGVFINGEFVTSLSSGTMVGEMALVDHRPRTATVMAETEMKMLRFHARQFRRLLDEMPKASERVMTLLHDRLTKDG
ncbi:MAG TPA: hypothetical protein DEG43_11630 [Acidimicrobiaceae bacterium]|jgi:CRP/FNR family cyclic AMP-dependent transcriptional regulator|nr:hypothetical protein [Acidimicrobiaceae bacterium]